MARKLRIGLTGGGSGGHIYPLLSVADSLRKVASANSIDLELRYFGPRDDFSEEVAARGIKMISVSAGKFRRYFSVANVIDIPKIIFGVVQAFFKLYFFMPDALFSKGGTGAFAVVFAAWFYRIPVIIHESDAIPGLNNVASARFANKIALSFEVAKEYFNSRKTFLTGNPLRQELQGTITDKPSAKENLQFDPSRPLIFIVCGSQGAKTVNEFVVTNIGEIMKVTQIFHQTGSLNFLDIQKLSEAALADIPVAAEVEHPYRIVPFIKAVDMKTAYAAADVVVGRSGSGTIFEAAYFGKPSILIPIKESANGHQRANAYAYAKGGAAAIIEEDNLSTQIFISQIKAILLNRELLGNMEKAAFAFAKPDAADLIAKETLKLALRV